MDIVVEQCGVVVVCVRRRRALGCELRTNGALITYFLRYVNALFFLFVLSPFLSPFLSSFWVRICISTISTSRRIRLFLLFAAALTQELCKSYGRAAGRISRSPRVACVCVCVLVNARPTIAKLSRSQP